VTFVRALLLIPLCLLVWFLPGCSALRPVPSTQQALFSVGTNTVGVLQTYVVPLLPTPWGPLAAGALATATAVLAAWNARQQRSLSQLHDRVVNGAAKVPVNVTGPPPA